MPGVKSVWCFPNWNLSARLKTHFISGISSQQRFMYSAMMPVFKLCLYGPLALSQLLIRVRLRHMSFPSHYPHSDFFVNKILASKQHGNHGSGLPKNPEHLLPADKLDVTTVFYVQQRNKKITIFQPGKKPQNWLCIM